MTLDRRATLLGAFATAAITTQGRAAALTNGPAAGIAFDAFTIFDPRRIADILEQSIPGRGREVASAWSTKLFAATWYVTAAGRYQSFSELADDALRAAVDGLNLDLSAPTRVSAVAAYRNLPIWPDVKGALIRLRGHGVKMAVLSNLEQELLDNALGRVGLRPLFDAVLSTDQVRRFKPAPAAYAMAIGALALPRERIGFAAFAGWDAIGATWFGYRTAWINRLAARPEYFAAKPAITSPGIEGALELAGLR